MHEKRIDILLVEDCLSDAEFTTEALQRSELRSTVHHVKDGEEALRYLFKRDEYAGVARPDLILLDLNMPEMDGRELLQKIQKYEYLMPVPVIILTASYLDKDLLSMYGLSDDHYVIKPLDLNSFFEVVQRAVNRVLQSNLNSVITAPP